MKKLNSSVQCDWLRFSYFNYSCPEFELKILTSHNGRNYLTLSHLLLLLRNLTTDSLPRICLYAGTCLTTRCLAMYVLVTIMYIRRNYFFSEYLLLKSWCNLYTNKLSGLVPTYSLIHAVKTASDWNGFNFTNYGENLKKDRISLLRFVIVCVVSQSTQTEQGNRKK
jgi:hypothetical protein